MMIPGLDPSGELGRLFFQVHSKDIQGQDSSVSRAPSRHPSTDAVDLSVLAREIRDYSSQAVQLPELRAEKIQRIQQALGEKAELATSEQVAGALIRDTILNALGS